MQDSTKSRSIYEKIKKKAPRLPKLPLFTGTRNAVLFPLSTSIAKHARRYEPCYLLWKNEISVVVWFEDLLNLHGGDLPVQGRDLYLLVQNPQEAAKTLKAAGYVDAPVDTEFEVEPEFRDQGVRMAPSMADTAVNLLPAHIWHYDLNKSAEGFLPPLHDFLDSMMEVWLRMSSQDYDDRLLFALHIARLINYCYEMQDQDGNIVKNPAYASLIEPSHRELHYDIVQEDPKAENFTSTKRHQYHVRRCQDIKDGLFLPQPYRKGAYRPDLTALQE